MPHVTNHGVPRPLQQPTQLGDGPATVTQGYGGWQEIARPGRRSATTWSGFQPFAIDLPLMLDGFDQDVSVEPAITALEAMAGRGSRAPGGEPPKLIVNTAGVMPQDSVAYPDGRWVITALDWDAEGTIVGDAGDRVRTAVRVSLLQHLDANTLEDRLVAEIRRRSSTASGKSGRQRTYRAKQGDTLVSIARSQLHDPGRWPDIKKLNGIRDPRAALKPGRVIKLP
jgi:nucleoid-associated protein YgaU